MIISSISNQLLCNYNLDKEKVITVNQYRNFLIEKGYKEAIKYGLEPCLTSTPHPFPVNGGISQSHIIKNEILTQRIISFYQGANSIFSIDSDSMWACDFLYDSKKENHDAFVRGDKQKVLSLLSNPGKNSLFIGFDAFYDENNTDKDEINAVASMVVGNLIRFAGYISSIRMYNDQSEYLMCTDVEEVLQKIDEALGIKVEFPNIYPGEVGIESSRGIISYRAVQALYQAYLVKEKIKEIKNPKVMEIGAGMGRTAYYLNKMGIKSYTIIDIPMTCVSQCLFLGTTLGDDKISLSGEKGSAEVRILIPNDLERLKDEHFDLIFNADSFTEMDDASREEYWEYMKTHSDIFLSVNHEANKRTVSEYYINSGYKYDRRLYPIRRGYLEETVYFN